MDERYNKQRYSISKKIFKLIGESFFVKDEAGNLCFFAYQKGMRLKEELTIYTDESKTVPLLTIKARSVLDFNVVYDIMDISKNERLGALRRKGFKSMLRDEWEILDVNDQVVGSIKEDDNVLALVRRFITSLIPQEFHGFIGDKMVWHFKQNFNFFLPTITLDMSHDTEDLMDNRLGIATAVLLSAIEGRQG
jgi:uncharacterized protein YxjI